jgi:DNA-directed RNA polymerase subunit N (RpoN/RPB10)
LGKKGKGFNKGRKRGGQERGGGGGDRLYVRTSSASLRVRQKARQRRPWATHSASKAAISTIGLHRHCPSLREHLASFQGTFSIVSGNIQRHLREHSASKAAISTIGLHRYCPSLREHSASFQGTFGIVLGNIQHCSREHSASS